MLGPRREVLAMDLAVLQAAESRDGAIQRLRGLVAIGLADGEIRLECGQEQAPQFVVLQDTRGRALEAMHFLDELGLGEDMDGRAGIREVRGTMGRDEQVDRPGPALPRETT